MLGLCWSSSPFAVRQAEDPAATATSRPSFEEFLAGVRTEALARGISAATLDRTLDGLTQRPVVIARDRAQPERIESLEDYVDARLTRHTVANARASLARHRAMLARVTAAYGIPARLMVAIWGLESNFGRFTGTLPDAPGAGDARL